ncbi:MAG: hypothetical protein KIT80_20570 [Chitinophagaceae bacterium]|nr:hypothetical protein [Chitinophagaceae bacterium]MCW5929327.1 hypothetical protein [Chitinophagaceae bacterium]
MKKTLLAGLVTFVLFFSGNSLLAQTNPVDPALISKEQKEIVKLQAKLLEDREKLADLYREKEKNTAQRDKKQADAQNAADKNADMARRLSNETESKQRARSAKKAANKASSEAKAARKAASRVEKNEKAIRNLERTIEKNEKKLEKLEQKVAGM